MPQPTDLVEIIKTQQTVEIFNHEKEVVEVFENDGHLVEIIYAGPRGPRGDDGTDGVDGVNGAPGVDGKTILSGIGAPDPGAGQNGDLYLDVQATRIYGPKTAGAWGGGVALIGPAGPDGNPGSNGAPGTNGTNGNTVLNGTGVPGTGLGQNGDFYLDTAASRLYGPKTAGAWGSGVSLIGATGPASILDVAIHAAGNTNLTLTNATAAEDWVSGGTRVINRADLTNFTQVRILGILNVIGSAGTKIRVKYRTAFSGNAAQYSDIGITEVNVPLDVTPTVALNSGWVNLAAGAKADVFFGPAVYGGDGVADPAVGNLHIQFR